MRRVFWVIVFELKFEGVDGDSFGESWEKSSYRGGKGNVEVFGYFVVEVSRVSLWLGLRGCGDEVGEF